MSIKVVSVKAIRAIEAAVDAGGLTYAMMMQNAGHAVARRVVEILKDEADFRPDPRVTVLVGPGNNGGDGLVAGLALARTGTVQVRFYLLKNRDGSDDNFRAVQEAGLFVALAEHDHDFRVLRNMVASADIVLDALFGVGVKLPLRPDVAKLMRQVTQALNDEQLPETDAESFMTPASRYVDLTPRRKPLVIAVDCPSGMDCDTGAVDNQAIRADETITFIAAKPGLFEFPGAGLVGELLVAPIGIDPKLLQLKDEKRYVPDIPVIRGMLPARPVNANKGTYGKTLIVAGSADYSGAAGLAARAAYRAGTGLVTVAAPEVVINRLSGHLLEPTWLCLPDEAGFLKREAAEILAEKAPNYDALLLGSGWGTKATTGEMLSAFLEVVSKSDKLPPLVIDADGLNLLSKLDSWWTLLPKNTVITPHPGEMGRLVGISTADILAKRWELAQRKATEWQVVLVLKGAHTLVAAPDGFLAVLPFKTDALATAGTGDVLAGLIAALLAQGCKPFEAAVVGGYLHGLAGQMWGRRLGTTRSVVAGDIPDALHLAFRAIEKAK